MIIFFTTQLLSVHQPGLRSVHLVPAQQNEGVGCDTAARKGEEEQGAAAVLPKLAGKRRRAWSLCGHAGCLWLPD